MLAPFALAFLQLTGVGDLVSFEKAFAARAREGTVRAAFLQFMDDKCILFRPGPVNGKEWFQKQQETPAQLQWEPVYAEASASGDLGYTTGPWTLRPKGPTDTDVATGHYMSIWKKGTDGQWRVILDQGAETPPYEGQRMLDLMPAGSNRNRPPATYQEITDREAQYSAEFSKDPAEAFPLYASRTIRLIWPGQPPVIGMKAAMPLLKPRSWKPLGGEIASSTDLGYTYGEYAGTGTGYYVHIWRREGLVWKLALEVLKPNEKN